MKLWVFSLSILWSGFALAQICENFGTVSGSTCLCPPGFGGTNCSVPACGGDIFQGSKRALVQAGGDFGNISSCSCENGWSGTGCNVCQSSNACQSAFNNISNGTTSTSPIDGPSTLNNSLTCNTSPLVYAAGEMSCRVLNPTLQSIFPLSSNLNILRTLSNNLSPLPNVTSFGTDGSIFAQLFYDGVEQFYCHASSCTHTDSTSGASDWNCTSLQCICRPGTDFCGRNKTLDLTQTINGLADKIEISCQSLSSSGGSTSCSFKHATIQAVFGNDGLSLSGCQFGECVEQAILDGGVSSNSSTAPQETTAKSLSGGVIAGLAVVGALFLLAFLVLFFGCYKQRQARLDTSSIRKYGGVGVLWSHLSYFIDPPRSFISYITGRKSSIPLIILDNVSGQIKAGEIMAILGPSGAGKTTFVECLSGKRKAGEGFGNIQFLESDGTVLNREPRIGYVDQLDILPSQLTPFEALLFAVNLRLPESVPKSAKLSRVYEVLSQLGLNDVANTRIGSSERRGISGGEMRRVTIGLELVGEPDILFLDEPTSGLDSVSAMKVVSMLKTVAREPENPRVVICSIHQPSSKIYYMFDHVLLLARGKCIYNGEGGSAASQHFASRGVPCPEGYNVADHLLDIASDPPPTLIGKRVPETGESRSLEEKREGHSIGADQTGVISAHPAVLPSNGTQSKLRVSWKSTYTTTFLTQLEVLSQREWKILNRDKTLFWTHIIVASVLGAFCGGLYFKTDNSIAGFQSRVGCLFFLGALIAFSSLSALYNLVEIRALFLRERSGALYSPTAWLTTRIVFDVVPLRLVPTIVVSTMTYWMAGLAHDASHFFKFLFILVLYTLAMTLYNFLLACLFRNGGVAILLSALSALYQMYVYTWETFAGFFVHLNSIPPVLRWLQWLCPLKYTLEALSVNEVGSGLMIVDKLEGVPVNVSASLIMQLLFGFGVNNYYRDVLVLFAFIAGFTCLTIATVWVKVRERR